MAKYKYLIVGAAWVQTNETTNEKELSISMGPKEGPKKYAYLRRNKNKTEGSKEPDYYMYAKDESATSATSAPEPIEEDKTELPF